MPIVYDKEILLKKLGSVKILKRVHPTIRRSKKEKQFNGGVTECLHIHDTT